MRAVRLLACLVLWSSTAAAEFDLPQLMAMLAQVERSTVAFEETRYLAILATPVVRRGTLQYVRPDRLEMHVFTPFPETMEVVGSRVRIESSEQRREWDLAGRPVALAWIEGIRASLAGDAATLTRLFGVALGGTSASWQLVLEPRDPRVAAALRRVEVRGRQAQLTAIEILDRQDDRIVITFKPVSRSGP